MMHFQQESATVERIDGGLAKGPRRNRRRRIGKFVHLAVRVTRSAIEVSSASGITAEDEIVAEVRRALGLCASFEREDVYFEDVLEGSTECSAGQNLDAACERLLDVVDIALGGTGLAVVGAHLQLRFGRYALRLRLRQVPSMLDDWQPDPRNGPERDYPCSPAWLSRRNLRVRGQSPQFQ